MGEEKDAGKEVEWRPVSSLTQREQDEITQLVIAANADRRELFPGPRLQPDTLTEQYGDHLALMIREGETLAGCGTVKVRDGAVWVFILAVDPSRRGRGLGARLIDVANRIAKGEEVDSLRLHAVDTGNLIAFYRRLGFEEVERERLPQGHWRATEAFDLVTMRRSVV